MNKIKNFIIGIIAAIIVAGLLIFVIETDRSILQMVFGFIFLVIPFSFISSFSSKIMSFVFTVFVVLLGYISYKMGYQDLWVGILQAAIIGGAIYYYRIRKTSTFSSSDYIEEAKNKT